MRQFTVQRVMLITLFALLFAIAVRVPVDTDTWWHIRSGEYTLNEGMIYTDPFSHTMRGENWVNHSWGSQMLIYGAWQAAGNVGLALYMAVLATAGMAVIYQMCAGDVYLRSFALVIGAATAAVFWSPRPQMVSFFLSTVILYLLYLYKRKQVDRLWFIPPLMLLWGNMHAGFSIGYIFIGGVIGGEVLANLFNPQGQHVISLKRLRKLVLVTLVSVPALMINPYGVQMLLVPFETVSIGALRDFIQEWNSPNFQERQTWPFIMLLLFTFGAAGASRLRLDWSDFALFSGTAFMSLLAGRNIAVFAVVATPIFTYHLADVFQERGWVFASARRVSVMQGRLNALLAGVIVLGTLVVALGILNPVTVEKAQRELLPVQVSAFIAAEMPRGPMFNSYNWGGYLMFALPEYPVYTDGRTDLYGSDFLLRYLRTAAGRDDWRGVLREDGVNLVVIEQGSGLAQSLQTEPGWTQIYPTADLVDEKAAVFVRDEPLENES
ncbi:MAG: hypothetical protein OHK0046_02790 [Anaerolineae bacterium]